MKKLSESLINSGCFMCEYLSLFWIRHGCRICGDTGSGFAGEIADETVFHQRINE